MATVVYKYPLILTDINHVTMPKGATILRVAMQHGRPHLWALVNPAASEHEERRIVIVGTGHVIPPAHGGLVYIGTFESHGGEFVWHTFEYVQ